MVLGAGRREEGREEGINHKKHKRQGERHKGRELTTDPASPEGYGRTGWLSILIMIVIVIVIEKIAAGERSGFWSRFQSNGF